MPPFSLVTAGRPALRRGLFWFLSAVLIALLVFSFGIEPHSDWLVHAFLVLAFIGLAFRLSRPARNGSDHVRKP